MMLLAVNLGGIGRALHEWTEQTPAIAHAGQANQSHRGGGDAPADHSRHDHEHCTVCQLLTAPRIDRLSETLIVVPVADPPRRGPAPLACIPHRVVVPTIADARAPPATPRA